MRKNNTFIYAFIFLFSLTVCFAQGLPTNYGILFGGGYNHYSCDLRQSGLYSQDVPRFATGSGGVIFGGAFYEYKLSRSVSIGSRLNYSLASVDYSKQFNSAEALENGTADVTIDNRIKFDIATIGLEPYLKLYALKELALIGGFDLGFALGYTKDYLTQKIVSPEDARFVGRKKTRTIADAEEPSGVNASFVLGAEFIFPVNFYRGMRMGFEAMGSFGYFKPEKRTTMDVNSLRVAVVLHLPTVWEEPPLGYTVPDTDPVAAVVPVLPKKEVPAPKVLDRVELIGVKNGTPNGIGELVVENYRHKRVTPILGYIFFDENSSRIPDRYSKPKPVAESGLDDYHNILITIAERMKSDSAAELYVTGCNSDEGGELGNIALSRARASAVADFLAARGVAAERIHKSARNLPEIPSNTFSDEGKAENRRVEISSNRPDVLSPIVTKDTAIFPDFDTIIAKTTGKKSYNSIRILNQGKEIFSSDSISSSDGFAWDFKRFIAENPDARGTIDIFMLEGNDTVAAGRFPIREIKLDHKSNSEAQERRFEEISLILFDFDKSEPSRANREMIREVSKTIDPDANVTAEGFTDNAGDESYNEELSRARAEKVAHMIKAKSVRAVGFGESRPLYGNETPEGRFYNRTVRLMIEVPEKK